MKIKYSVKSKAVVKLLSIIGDSNYRFGINGNSKEIWFVLNKKEGNALLIFDADNRELQDQIYFYVFGKLPQAVEAYSREWSNVLEKDILERSKKLFPARKDNEAWYLTEINKHNVQEVLDYLKGLYEN